MKTILVLLSFLAVSPAFAFGNGYDCNAEGGQGDKLSVTLISTRIGEKAYVTLTKLNGTEIKLNGLPSFDGESDSLGVYELSDVNGQPAELKITYTTVNHGGHCGRAECDETQLIKVNAALSYLGATESFACHEKPAL